MKYTKKRMHYLLSISLIILNIGLLAHEISYADVQECEQITITTQDFEQWLEYDLAHKRSFGSLGVNFTAATSQDILSAPPDQTGAVGPTQYILMINGWIRSFNKASGRADNILNVALPRFFAPITNNEDVFDVRINFDRLSNRWFMLCEEGGPNNKMFIAVSDGPIITPYSKWRFSKFIIGSPGFFADYPTLGIDANALYIGVSLFPEPNMGQEVSTRVFVLPKAPFVSGGTLQAFAFNNLTDMSGNGASTAQGVTNFDPTATQGYFIGVDNSNTSLVVYRVSNPGTVPTISAPIFVTSGFVPFEAPIEVPTKNGQAIDGGDSRLLCAHIRFNQLWTVHGAGVDNTGNLSPATVTRVAARWYQLNVTPATPTIVQSGTLFTATGTNTTTARSYIYPSLMSSGQSNMVLGCSTAGTNEFINAAIACRAASDPAGTLRTPVLYTSSTTSYDNQGTNRWGDYNTVVLDPVDDMTMWALQQFCSAKDQWGCRVVQVLAPAPATPISATSVASGQASVNTVVTGNSVSGSGFYDPGAGFTGRLRATVSGGVVVNSVTFVSPTQVQLNLNTVGKAPGTYTITITNPDGQSVVGTNILTLT